MIKKSLSLYQVLTLPNRVVVGTFGSKLAAVNAMRKTNKVLVKGIDSPVFVAPGPDHWRYATDRTVPARGAEYSWITVEGEPALLASPW